MICDLARGLIWFVAKKKRDRNLFMKNKINSRKKNFFLFSVLGQLLILWSRSSVCGLCCGFLREIAPSCHRCLKRHFKIYDDVASKMAPRCRWRRRRCILSSRRSASRLCSHLPPARLPALFSVHTHTHSHSVSVSVCVCVCDGAWSAFPSLFLKCDTTTTTTHAPNSVRFGSARSVRKGARVIE